MATKTITLEIDACEKLRNMKRGGESFTEVAEVVRRAVRVDAPATGEYIFAEVESGVSEKYLDSVEAAAAHYPITDDPWA